MKKLLAFAFALVVAGAAFGQITRNDPEPPHGVFIAFDGEIFTPEGSADFHQEPDTCNLGETIGAVILPCDKHDNFAYFRFQGKLDNLLIQYLGVLVNTDGTYFAWTYTSENGEFEDGVLCVELTLGRVMLVTPSYRYTLENLVVPKL